MTIPVQHRRRKPDFSLATINIVFLLLLYFLLAGTLVQKGEVDVDLAETRTLPLDRLPRPLLLVNRDGGLSFNGDPVRLAEVPERARSFLEDSGGAAHSLNILASRNMPARQLTPLIETLAVSGVPIRLVTLRAGFAVAGAQ